MTSLPVHRAETLIRVLRGHRVMFDRDLAELYGVPSKALIQAVKRNEERFPADFMFQLTEKEFDRLRSQFVTSNRGGRRYRPYVFTEQGVAMLSSVLRSRRAVLVNVNIMRAFVRLRQMTLTSKVLADKLADLERRVETHDEHIQAIFDAIRELMSSPQEPALKIGFKVER